LTKQWNQAKNGDVDPKTEPSKFEMVKHAKYQARKRVKGMTKEQAMKKYVQECHRIDGSWSIPGGSTVSKETDEDEEEDSVGTKNFQPAPGANKSEMEKCRPTFEQAVEFARTSGLFENQATRSILYAYYKSATVGPCTKPAPSILAGRKKYARWRAWSNNFDMKPEEAMRKYVELVRKVAPEFDAKDPAYFMTADGRGAAMISAARRNSAIARESALPRPTTVSEVLEALDKVKADGNNNVYLITGATGFIGKHLIRELLKKYPTSLYLCVTRESSFPKIATFFPQDPNVVPVAGDIASPALGMNKDLLKGIQARGAGAVNHFFHLAAVYDMKATKEANEKANVQGTREAVNLANSFGAKTVFQYASSIAVAGDFDGIFTEEMFNEGQAFDHDYLRTKFEAEQVVRKECKVPYRLYRPGLVLGSSETGEADKIDGPYYIFKPLQRLSRVCPSILTLPCIQGELMPIVPVDYVVKAMAYIAHKKGLDGRSFHLVDPNPPLFIDMLNIFAEAANAPSFSSRLSEMVLAMIPRKAYSALQDIPIVADAPTSVGAHVLGIPDTVMAYVNSRTTFDDAGTQEALRGSNIKCPPLKQYGWKLWDYYARHMDPAVDKFGALRQEVTGKIVVVTGSSDGIGEVLANRLGDAGAKVVLVARSKEKLEVVQKSIQSRGGIAFTQVADLSDKDSTQKAIQEILKKHGTVDILVNNAGKSIRRSVEYQYDPERFHDFTRTMDLNAYGALRMVLGVLPQMRKQKSGQIINVSSIGVLTGPPRFGAYVASKAYIDAFARCVSSECAKDNVVFSTTYIPLTKTKMIISKDSNYNVSRFRI
jgi:short-subunit dehydrogenase/acyl-CoA-binding protein